MTSVCDLTARWHADAWAFYAAGRPELAALCWAHITDLEENAMPDSALAVDYIAAGGMGGAQAPRFITIHATCPSSLVAADPYLTVKPGMARNTANYFSRITNASAHYTVDVEQIVQSVPENRKAWHDGHNTDSIGIEVCGQAAWTRDQWTRSDVIPVIGLTAALVADIADRWGIPLRWQTDDEIRAGVSGVRTHEDVSRVLRVSDHTDPGPGFPRDLLLTTGGLTMSDISKILTRLDDIEASVASARTSITANGNSTLNYVRDQEIQTRGVITALAKAIVPAGAPMSAEQIVAAAYAGAKKAIEDGGTIELAAKVGQK